MSIRIVCACGSKLDAPDSFLGKKGKCPKCGAVFLIQPSAAPTPKPAAPTQKSAAATPAAVKQTPSPDKIIVNDLPSLLHTEGFPKRIERLNLYVILGSDRVIAFLKAGEGWQLNTGHGFSNARQENQLIPGQGTFALIEGIVHETENGRRLVGIQFFKLDGRACLLAIARNESEILEKITGRTTMTLSQKRQLLLYIRDRFFADFTADAPEIIEYLTGEDFHSEQIGDCACENTDGLPR